MTKYNYFGLVIQHIITQHIYQYGDVVHNKMINRFYAVSADVNKQYQTSRYLQMVDKRK